MQNVATHGKHERREELRTHAPSVVSCKSTRSGAGKCGLPFTSAVCLGRLPLDGEGIILQPACLPRIFINVSSYFSAKWNCNSTVTVTTILKTLLQMRAHGSVEMIRHVQAEDEVCDAIERLRLNPPDEGQARRQHGGRRGA